VGDVLITQIAKQVLILRHHTPTILNHEDWEEKLKLKIAKFYVLIVTQEKEVNIKWKNQKIQTSTQQKEHKMTSSILNEMIFKKK